MGADFWEYTAPFDADSSSVKAILFKHKAKILSLTGDWETISITDSPVPPIFSLAPLPQNIDADDDESFEEFLDEIERGTGYYQISYEGKKPVSVHFFGYSCD